MPLNMPYFIWLCMPNFTLSSTVRLEKRRMFWKVRATPRLLTCTVLMPLVSWPSIMMLPRVG